MQWCHFMVGVTWLFVVIVYKTKLYQIALEPNLWEEFTTRQQLQTGGYTLTCMECSSAGSIGCYRKVSFAARLYRIRGLQERFRPVSCWGQEIRTERPQMQRNLYSVQFCGFRVFCWFFRKSLKIFKRIATLANDRDLHPAAISVAFSRLSQSVSVRAVRGTAVVLIAQDAIL